MSSSAPQFISESLSSKEALFTHYTLLPSYIYFHTYLSSFTLFFAPLIFLPIFLKRPRGCLSSFQRQCLLRVWHKSQSLCQFIFQFSHSQTNERKRRYKRHRGCHYSFQRSNFGRYQYFSRDPNPHAILGIGNITVHLRNNENMV